VTALAECRWAYSEVAARSGINFRHRASKTTQKYLIETMGAGVAWLDYDGDGWLDLFFVNGAALADPLPKGGSPDKSEPRYWNRLYRNTGRGAFVDVTEKAGLEGRGYGMGVAVGDYDNDGRPDLYVTGFGGNTLYRNRGDGAFEDVTEAARVAGSGWSSGAVFLDYDLDGDLDLAVARYLEWDFERNPWCGPRRVKQRGYCHPNAFPSVGHLLFENLGNAKFRDVSRQSGLGAHPGKGLGVAVADFDGDGWPDIAVANDSVAQQLFRNNRDGTFAEAGGDAGIAYNADGRAFAGMGIDFQDYDNDARPDLFINALSLEGYVLFRHAGANFEDESAGSGIRRLTLPYAGWGARLVDYDNDGWKDLFVAQGHVMDTITLDFPQIPYKQPLLLLKNAAGRFENAGASAGPAFQAPLAGRGAAFGDMNNDGCMDIAVNVNDGAPLLLKNECSGKNWILIELIGTASNRDAIGAELRLNCESGLRQHSMATTSGSYLSASDKRVHFGLGEDSTIKEIEIRWPSGRRQVLKAVKANQVLRVTEPATE
jgi:hypothetical protein